MPWRNPATGLFESGNGPVDRRAPTAQRGGNIHGGWDYIAQPGGDSDGKGGEVHSVDDVLTSGQGFADKQEPTMAYTPAKADKVPMGQGRG